MAANYNTYDFQDGQVCFISTSDNYYHRTLTPDIVRLLAEIDKAGGVLEERTLVALNRWIMGKDKALNRECSKSQKMRNISITPALRKQLHKPI